jgi:hypothetical protein
MKKNVVPFPVQQPTLDSQLRFAIAHKRLIRFSYDGVIRVAEPHDYGQRDGADKVLAYQRQKGGRKDQNVRGWRWLDASKIEHCTVLEDSFKGTREASDQQHHQWDVLFARVD